MDICDCPTYSRSHLWKWTDTSENTTGSMAAMSNSWLPSFMAARKFSLRSLTIVSRSAVGLQVEVIKFGKFAWRGVAWCCPLAAELIDAEGATCALVGTIFRRKKALTRMTHWRPRRQAGPGFPGLPRWSASPGPEHRHDIILVFDWPKKTWLSLGNLPRGRPACARCQSHRRGTCWCTSWRKSPEERWACRD